MPKFFPIKSKSVEDIKEALKKLLYAFGLPIIIVIDNERARNSASICFMVEDQLGI